MGLPPPGGSETQNILYERHRKSVLRRCAGEKVLLAVSDTTELDYTRHPETDGLGPLSDLVHHGMLLHPTLVVTPERVPLGVIDVVFEEYEWKALYVFANKSRDAVPKEVPTLQEVTRTLGRLGGHLGRKGDGEPGALTMWRGLQRLPDISDMWMIYDALPTTET